ncbi:unnamed protein product, partial [Meganyctiphanes norvegica]
MFPQLSPATVLKGFRTRITNAKYPPISDHPKSEGRYWLNGLCGVSIRSALQQHYLGTWISAFKHFLSFRCKHIIIILYIWACPWKTCWAKRNRLQSWTCIRSQLKDPESIRASPTQSPPPSAISNEETWFDDEDDWGNDNDGNGNSPDSNFKTSSQIYLDNMIKKSGCVTENVSGESGSNLNNMNSNTSMINDVARCMERKLNLIKDDPNANEALVCGAVGMVIGGSDGAEASALIEGPEGDMIAIDTPEQPTTDIPALFQEAAVIDANVDVTFIPYYLVSDVEPGEEKGFSEHERDLLTRYTHDTGHQLREEDEACGDGKGGDGVYEKDVAHHGDVLLHKFKKRISRSPQQVLRYCREPGANPLWLHPPSPQDLNTKCSHCGAPTIPELQITPQAIINLKVASVTGTPLEFGTVVVYSCVDSCWIDTDPWRQENVIVQCEVI